MSTADLDINLERWEASSQYTVELRLSLPSSEADPAPVRGVAQFETSRLSEHSMDADAYGSLLMQGLFADPPVREFFKVARISAEALDIPLRLRLRVDPSAQELHTLRWETLRDPQRDLSLVTSERILFSRHLSSPDFRPVRLRPRGRLRALLMVASPDDLSRYRPGGQTFAPIDAAGEQRRVQAALGDIPLVALASGGEATLNNLCTHLRDGYDILYLVCHGALIDGEPWLWLESSTGQTARASGHELVDRLAEIQQRPTLVVLASCQSAGTGDSLPASDGGTMAALGPRLAEAGTPAVLAMQGNISIESAAAFMPVFFAELRRDGQIDRAMAAARGAIRSRADHWMPALFMRLKSGCIWRAGDIAETTPSLQAEPTARATLREEPAQEEEAAPHPSPRNNLPRQLTSFIGREKEVSEVKSLLADTSLLTLTGSGGCGKTRLALLVAGELVEQFPDGVSLVELGALTEPALVPHAVAAALEVREEADRPLTKTLSDFLGSRSFLLILDNCEHLVLACAELAQALLRLCPKLQVLATSREALEVPGELIYQVPPLSHPDPRHLPPLEKLLSYEAIRLFVERAALVQPRFCLCPENASQVAQICRQLDGIPLAIELAAARVKVLSVEQIGQRLDDRFRLLTGGSRTALKHQQTLRALIDWSYELLSTGERRLLQRLSVFAGGWSLEAAEAVCRGHEVESWEVLDLLAELVDKSLVVSEEWEGEGRFHLLSTVRQYARDRLVEAGEEIGVRSQHRDYFLRLAEEAEPELRAAEQTAWLERLEGEHDNLRAAIAWSIEQQEVEPGLRLGAALWQFWHVRGHLREGRDRLQALLSLPGAQVCGSVRAKALNGAGALADYQGDYAGAALLHEESLALARTCDDRESMAYALFSLGNVAWRQERYEEARSVYEEVISLWRGLGNHGRVATVLGNQAMAEWQLGHHDTAISLSEESLALHRQVGNQVNAANMLNNLGHWAIDQGDYARAAALLADSLRMFHTLESDSGIASTLNNFARLAVAQNDLQRAACLLAKVKALDESTGFQVSEDYEQNLTSVQAGLGETAFAAAEQQGQSMELEATMELALAIRIAPPEPAVGPRPTADLPDLQPA
jgi:predicted ATPase